MKKKTSLALMLSVAVLLLTPIISSEVALANGSQFITTVGEGGSVRVHTRGEGQNDINTYRGPSSVRFADGGLTEIIEILAIPAAGWQFDGWYSGGRQVATSAVLPRPARLQHAPNCLCFSCGGVYTVQHLLLEARFSAIPVFYFNVSASPNDGGFVSGGGSFSQGETATLQAAPNPGWRFEHWTDGAAILSSDVMFSFTADGDRAITAIFQPIATPVAVSIGAGAQLTSVSAFRIEGSTFARLRDLALALRQTQQNFDIAYDTATSTVTLFSGRDIPDGEITGLQPIPTNVAVSQSPILLDGTSLNVLSYRIDGAIYVPIGRFSEELGLELIRNEAADSFTLIASEFDVDIIAPDDEEMPERNDDDNDINADVVVSAPADNGQNGSILPIILGTLGGLGIIGGGAFIAARRKKQTTPTPDNIGANTFQGSGAAHSKFCTSCGAQLNPDSRFCGSCGKSV